MLTERALKTSGLGPIELPFALPTDICPQASRPWRAGRGQQGLAVPVPRSLGQDVSVSVYHSYYILISPRQFFPSVDKTEKYGLTGGLRMSAHWCPEVQV